MVGKVYYGLDSWLSCPAEAYWMFSHLSVIFQLTLQRVHKQIVIRHLPAEKI